MTTNVAYSQSLLAGGGLPPYAFTTAAGALPPGVVVTAAGVVTGTPTKAGNYAVLIRVTDSSQATAQRGFSIIVAAGSVSAPTPVPTPAQYTLSVINGTGTGTYPPYTTVASPPITRPPIRNTSNPGREAQSEIPWRPIRPLSSPAIRRLPQTIIHRRPFHFP